MPSAVTLRADYSAADLRVLAKRTKDNHQSRRLLSLAAVLDGMNRTDAARIGGMDRQTLRDWVHRFNQQGPVANDDSDNHGLSGRVVQAVSVVADRLITVTLPKQCLGRSAGKDSQDLPRKSPRTKFLGFHMLGIGKPRRKVLGNDGDPWHPPADPNMGVSEILCAKPD